MSVHLANDGYATHVLYAAISVSVWNVHYQEEVEQMPPRLDCSTRYPDKYSKPETYPSQRESIFIFQEACGPELGFACS